ncbi:MAG TPA: lactonase family protein [Verrucomicrobiae bacterium]|nr:lactonase family protein [Verrucomicrobiae bacterium]
MRSIRFFAIASALFCCLVCCAVADTASQCLVYFGTYTGAKSKGIYVARMDLATGALSSLDIAAETPNPTFLEVDARHHRLYAANEIGKFEGKNAGSVSAFSIEPDTGKLTLLNVRTSGGGGPCHVVLDKQDKNVLVANYGGGSVEVLPVLPDGTLGEATAFVQHEGKSVNPSRQEKPHAHCVTLDPANRFAFVCDLGIDKIMSYRFDPAHGTLTPNEPAFFQDEPGAGPRHLTFAPNGHFAYLINELGSTMTALAYDAANGSFRELQTLPMLPDDFKGFNLSAEVVVDASGKHVYGSNRGHDSIAVFDVNRSKGTLKLAQRQSVQGKTPRHFAIDPTGKFMVVANQDSSNVVVFAINPRNGKITPTGQTLEVPSPVCVKFFEAR